VGRLHSSGKYKENIRMKKYAAFAASVAISGAMLVGCGGEDDFCGDAEDIVGGSIPSGDQLQELADAAPDEIQDDFQVLADANADPASADQAAITEASDNIAAWGEDNCDS
jgi:hypothetical protein